MFACWLAYGQGVLTPLLLYVPPARETEMRPGLFEIVATEPAMKP